MYREWTSQLAGAVGWQRTVPAAQTYRVLPDGCMDLIWANGRLFVAGPDTAAQVVTAAPGDSYIGLRFPPGTGPAVVGVPASELRDQRVPLADLWRSADVRRLTDWLSQAPDVAAALEAVAAGRLGPTATPEPAIAEIAARLGAGATVAATAATVGLSERQLHRRCLAAFGYGPKTLARIMRMNRALAMARAGTPLAIVAATAGYADQAHLAREVREFAGVPLGALRS